MLAGVGKNWTKNGVDSYKMVIRRNYTFFSQDYAKSSFSDIYSMPIQENNAQKINGEAFHLNDT
jgi:hypothetical protein